MKQLSKVQSILFLSGGAMMVIGAGCFAFMWQQHIVCWIYLLGALLFGVIQMMQPYEGSLLTVKRLKKIMTFADVLFILSGLLMVDMVFQFFKAAFSNYLTYYQLVYNKWVVLLLVAALLEMYTMHRIGHELSKTKSQTLLYSQKILKAKVVMINCLKYFCSSAIHIIFAFDRRLSYIEIQSSEYRLVSSLTKIESDNIGFHTVGLKSLLV